MLPGVPHESRWLRLEPRRNMPTRVLERLVHSAFPRSRVIEIQPLTHAQLSDIVVTELVELIRATVENRDPQLE